MRVIYYIAPTNSYFMVMSQLSTPLISGLCVTRGKPHMLHRAITCFEEQTYPNKQLVVVYEDDDCKTQAYLKSRSWSAEYKLLQIQVLPVKKTLGELRNLSVSSADGEYVCQWDDDDWYDSDRMSVQMEHIRESGLPACILSRWVVFDSVSQKAYISNRRLWEGSILCRKDIMQQKPYPELSIGEDTAVIDYLAQHKLLAIIEDMPELYIYIYHGGNTWQQQHFTQIFNASMLLGPEDCEQVRNVLEMDSGPDCSGTG